MNRLQIRLEHIQHITRLEIDLDLSSAGIMCLVGRNGAGKTTLIRALRNLSSADTFIKTATPYAFSPKSRITYTTDDYSVSFSYDKNIRSLNSRDTIPTELRNLISAELPMPHGTRFNYFKNASDADLDIRRAIALGDYEQPDELVAFLNAIYGSEYYSNMVEVKAKGKSYYAIVKEDTTYIREDYLSSGEYFIINLYRTIKGASRLIVIDEIDISLDAAAQANLASWLRGFCDRYDRKILFTTHSLALIKQLKANELYYVSKSGGQAKIEPTSYSYAKARLFGFSGWDKYILTEDSLLLSFIETIIERYVPERFFSYKVIYVGGGSQVVSLMKYNKEENFLSSPNEVIAILDGDQKNEKHLKESNVFVIPIESVEKAIFAESKKDPDFPFETDRRDFTSAKDFHNYLKQKRVATQKEIFDYLITKNEGEFQDIVGVLSGFLVYEKIN